MTRHCSLIVLCLCKGMTRSRVLSCSQAHSKRQGSHTVQREEDEQPQIKTPCKRDPRLFFSTDLVDQKRAKAMCKLCPLRAACLAKSFRIEAVGGIWGGFDDVERSFYAKLFGVVPARVVQELPAALVRRLEANKVMKTGPDVELAMEA